MKNTLIIGDLIVPTYSINEFDQEYEDIDNSTLERTADGSGVIYSLNWQKIRTRITGRGWAPSGLRNLAKGQFYRMRCKTPDAVLSDTTSVTLPAERRTDTDHDPVGFASVGDELVSSAITGISSNVATLTAVAGADGYMVWYWPDITVAITQNSCQMSANRSSRWSIEAEQQ